MLPQLYVTILSSFHSILILCSFHFVLASILFPHLLIGLQPRGTNCSEYGTRGWYTISTQEPGCGATRRKPDDNSDQISLSIFSILKSANLNYTIQTSHKLRNYLRGGTVKGFNRRFNTKCTQFPSQ